MDGKTRRELIISKLKEAQEPISGSALASATGVSRQVIVQDIALLRTEYPILATAQGYLIYSIAGNDVRRAFTVKHEKEQIRDELMTIVNLGGKVLDVIVEHDVYGQLSADLNLKTPEDVDSLCGRLEQSSSGPLYPISNGVHIHTVEAESDAVLDRIELSLIKKKYLLNY